MPPQEAFHQFLASTGSYKVVPVKATGPQGLMYGWTQGLGTWLKIGNCEWQDVGPCY